MTEVPLSALTVKRIINKCILQLEDVNQAGIEKPSTKKIFVFNIHGNSYRLIVDLEYRLKIVFVVWFGTHKQYDKINTKTVSYAKTS